MSLFFVGGVGGVGKSTLCEALKGPLNAEHLKASELLHFKPEQSDPTRRAVANVEESQRQIVRVFKARTSSKPNTLLDGHYCLVNTSNRISAVPVTTFLLLRPAALLLVEAEPSVIVQRLQGRPGQPYSLEFLKQLIVEERRYAITVAATLDVPLQTWSSTTPIEGAIEFFLSAALLRPNRQLEGNAETS